MANNIEDTILKMNIDELTDSMKWMIKRYQQLEPENEINILFLPKKSSAERANALQQICEFLQYTKPRLYK